MKFVDQTHFSGFVGDIPDGTPPEEIGNCLQAAIASLLEMPLEAVPHFAASEGDWAAEMIEWLRVQQYGFVNLTNQAKPWPGFHLLSGKSPRGDFLHTVVARGDQIVHDPHPSRDGVRDAQDRWLLVPFDPANAGAYPELP